MNYNNISKLSINRAKCLEDLKTVEGHTSGGSNPSLSAKYKGLLRQPFFIGA
jgi:hypothetical protein